MQKAQNTRECMINKKPEYGAGGWAGGWAGGGVNSSSCVQQVEANCITRSRPTEKKLAQCDNLPDNMRKPPIYMTGQQTMIIIMFALVH